MVTIEQCLIVFSQIKKPNGHENAIESDVKVEVDTKFDWK